MDRVFFPKRRIKKLLFKIKKNRQKLGIKLKFILLDSNYLTSYFSLKILQESSN